MLNPARKPLVDLSPPPLSGPSVPCWLPNPFAAEMCLSPFEVAENRSVPGMNQEVFQRLVNAIEHRGDRAGLGRSDKPVLLLTAPRAGYGKTHLLGRIAGTVESRVVAVPLVFRADMEVTWTGVSQEAVEVLRHLPGKTPGWSRLREVCAGIIASMVLQLIRDGRLPCANKEQAIRVLSADPADLFQPGTKARMIGDWLNTHYPQLRKPLIELAEALPDAGAMDGWVDTLFAAAHDGSMASLEAIVMLAGGSQAAFVRWLRLVTLWRPVVLFVDHLNGFYRQDQSGLRVATMLLELAELEGVNVVLSLNQDVWQSTFAPHLPSALEDRLTAAQFTLGGLSAADATDLLQMRLRESQVPETEAQRFEAFVDVPRYYQGLPADSVPARTFLRHCASQWGVFLQVQAGGDEPVSLLDFDEGPQGLLLDDDDALEAPIFEADDVSRVKRLLSGLHEPLPAAPPPPAEFSAAAGALAESSFGVAPPVPSAESGWPGGLMNE